MASADELIRRCGMNTGNLLFTTAVMRQIAYRQAEAQLTFDPDDVNERFDQVVIPAANWLNERFDYFAQLASLIEPLTIPVVLIGIGAQASADRELPRVPDGTVRLMRAIADRCVSIGARGEFTRDVLRAYGITNVEVIGCPSLYWHGSHRPVVRKRNGSLRLVMGATGFAGSAFADDRVPATRLRQRELYRFAHREGAAFVYQSERPEIDLLVWPDEVAWDDTLRDTVLWYYSAPTLQDWISYVRTHGRCFLDAEDWIAAMGQYDFYLGSRLHGAVAALQAGTPACLLTHDSRTIELAHFAGIPTRPLSDVDGLSRDHVQRFHDEADFTEWQRRYPSQLASYVRFLEANGVRHRLLERPHQSAGG
jgi:hypothetical protein